ncbi:MAG: cell surface protein SprA [Bacteroidetes bacterium QH_8_67_23]|nr:MAG: cell surface protein SprA [Bacteroidetes bacterium QH_8_67_23]
MRAATDTVGTPGLDFVEQIRLWTTGHRAPMTLRFATLELVGSQWRKSKNVTLSDTTRATPDPDAADGSRLSIASINNEEDSGIYQPPERAVVAQQQVATGGRQRAREQSLVLRVEDLREGQRRAIFKKVQDLNLLKYGGLRMFTHLHSTAGDFSAVPEQARGNVELFVRLGSNETEDYYEYRQPLTPTLGPLSSAPVERLWYPLDAASGRSLANEMNLRLTALNQLKVARDAAGAPLDTTFWSREKSVTLDPALSSFAPAGATVGIKGTPSLQDVSTVVVGLRISDEAERNEYEDLTLWINELSATGYDESDGWSALADARIKLADFANLNANVERQTDGFGSLASTLGERKQNRLLDWKIGGDVSAGKLLPDATGWRIPVSFSFSSNTSTPRYAPNRGDVRLNALLAQAETGALPATRREVLRTAQTRNSSHRVQVGVQKTNSSSPWLRYTLDNLNFDYTLSQSSRRDPSQQLNDNWQWNANLDYQHDFQQPHTVQPLWFLESLPLVGGALGGLRFNYAPQSVGFFSSFRRRGQQQQDRSTRPLVPDSGSVLREPIRDTHTFNHKREFDFQYDPFGFLSLTYNNVTNQSLNRLGARETFRVLSPGGGERVYDSEARADTAISDYVENNPEGEAPLKERRLSTRGAGEAFGRFFGSGRPRTGDYAQRFGASLDLPFGDSEALNWIELKNLRYRANYNWNNSPRGSDLGATVKNNATFETSLSLTPQKLWRKFGFYRRLEKQQEEAAQSGSEEERRPSDDAPKGDDETSDDETSDDEADDDEADDGPQAGSDRSFSDLPLPNPLGLLRRLFLGVTGLRDFTVNYETTLESTATHVGFRDENDQVRAGYSLLDALQNEGPPLAYRFGLSRRIGTGLRLPGDNYALEDRLRDSNKLRARTTVQFSENFQIGLKWRMNWDETTTFSNLSGEESRTQDGSNTSSVWAFGGGYRAFFDRQLEALRGDLDSRDTDGDGTPDVDADGRVALSNASVSDDFRSAFTSSFGSIGQNGFLSLPLPSWQVTYSGLSDWPLLGALTQNVSLTHGYSSEYATSFSSTQIDESVDYAFVNGAGYQRASFEVGGQSVQERFQPLLGLDVSWKGALSTNLQWNRSNTFRLRPASEEVVEDHTNELSFTADYRKQGLTLSFLPFIGDIENQITLSLTASRTVERQRDFIVRRALNEAATAIRNGSSYDPSLALEGENVSVRSSSTRLEVAPKISYRFSDRVSVDFVMRYEQFEGNRRPSYSNIDGGFNVRLSLQQ